MPGSVVYVCNTKVYSHILVLVKEKPRSSLNEVFHKLAPPSWVGLSQ